MDDSTLFREGLVRVARDLGFDVVGQAGDAQSLTELVRADPPDVVAELVGRRRHRDAIEELTGRERDVLHLMAQGRTNSAIGSRLHLSPKTVEAHIRNIFMKLQLEPAEDDHRRVLAVLTYLRA